MPLRRTLSLAVAAAAALLLGACSGSAPSTGSHTASSGLISPTPTKPPPANLVKPTVVPLPHAANVPIRLPTWSGDVFDYSKAVLLVFQSIALSEKLPVQGISLAVVPHGKVVYCSENYGGPMGDAPDGIPNPAVVCDPLNSLILVTPGALAKDNRDLNSSGALGDLLYAYVQSIPIPHDGDPYDQEGSASGIIMGVLFGHQQVSAHEVQQVLEDNRPYGYESYIYGFVQGWASWASKSDKSGNTFAQAFQLLLSTPQTP